MEQAGNSFVVWIDKPAMRPEPLSSTEASHAPAGSAFPATLWTVVQHARSEEPGQAVEAVRTLCVRYQRAIHAWFQRSRPHWIPPARAEEWAQDFLLFMQDKNPFRSLERRESRFRSFLVSCLKNFLKDKLDVEGAAKRGGHTEHVDISDLEVAGQGEVLEEILDAEFARELHERALARVEADWARKGSAQRYAALKCQILGNADRAYEELATGLGITANHVKKIVFDLRETYYDAFRDEVAQTVPDRQTLEEEMRYLIGLLARDRVGPA
jgi:DNA-directed RNA polymerase specialized sigma24 family protein